MTATCIVKRWWAKVDLDNPHGCWLWTAAVSEDGYGTIGSGRKGYGRTYAHLLAYDLFIGDRPGGNLVTVDHLCGNRSCCNPDHLRLGPHRANINATAPLDTFEQDCGIDACFRCAVLYRSDVEAVHERADRPARRTKCTVKNCGERHHARGLCGTHYHQWRREQRAAEAVERVRAVTEAAS